MMLDLLFWVVCGGLAGWIASMLVTGDNRTAAPAYVTMGIMGAVIGGMLSRWTGAVGTSGLDIFGTISAIFGSVLLVMILLLLSRENVLPNK